MFYVPQINERVENYKMLGVEPILIDNLEKIIEKVKKILWYDEVEKLRNTKKRLKFLTKVNFHPSRYIFGIC